MKIPRLSHWDQFYILEDNVWRLITPQEVVSIYNTLAERYELVLEDVEEIVNGYSSGSSKEVRPGTASTA